jgi:hypothetical protein
MLTGEKIDETGASLEHTAEISEMLSQETGITKLSVAIPMKLLKL